MDHDPRAIGDHDPRAIGDQWKGYCVGDGYFDIPKTFPSNWRWVIESK